MKRTIRSGLLAALVAVAAPAAAQDEPQTFNAFAVVAANGSIVRAAEKQLMLVGTLTGPLFVETDEGPIHGGRVACAASLRIDQATRRVAGTGACTVTVTDGATAWGDWECQGYELLGCRGTFKLSGGTARLEGATGEGTMIWRPSAAEFKKQLDGTVLENTTGLLSWRDVRLKTK